MNENEITLTGYQVAGVGKDCVGLVVKVPEDSYFDIEFTKKVFEKKFPGLPIVYQYGLDVHMVYADDDAFKRAVLDVLRRHPKELMKLVPGSSMTVCTNGLTTKELKETWADAEIGIKCLHCGKEFIAGKDDHPRYTKTCEADKAKFDETATKPRAGN